MEIGAPSQAAGLDGLLARAAARHRLHHRHRGEAQPPHAAAHEPTATVFEGVQTRAVPAICLTQVSAIAGGDLIQQHEAGPTAA